MTNDSKGDALDLIFHERSLRLERRAMQRSSSSLSEATAPPGKYEES